jgi:predicted dehydrogenase
MSEQVNVLVVGAGTHGERSHLEPLLHMPGLAQVVAVADNRRERLDELAEKHNLADGMLYEDWTKVIGRDDIDAVVGALPDDLHMDLAEAAIAARKHLLSEKPLAATREQYDRLPGLLAEAQRKELVYMPCNPREAAEPWSLLKTYVQDRGHLSLDFGVGDLGPLVGVNIESHYTAADPNKEGMHSSLVADKLSHDMMTLDQLVGIKTVDWAVLSPQSGVDTYTANLVARYDAPDGKGDRQERLVELRSHARRTIDRDFRADGKGIYHETARLAFAQGSLALDTTLGTMTVWWGDQKTEKQSDQYRTNYDKLFLAFNRHFLRAVRGEAQCFTDKAKLLSTVAAIALEESEGRAISIDVPEGS